LPNPFYVPELKELTGNEKAVQEYINAQPQTAKFLRCLENMVDCVVEEFVKKDKPQLVISVGCTGGRHRSVYVANMLVQHLLAGGFNAQTSHRDIDR
ncbi:MAG: RNase adaptor protein RapZ, partial [Acidaminococcaceae bacterium]|nr:RNase adaptor protein RapZ [Acidaminococcaceae bacterium]